MNTAKLIILLGGLGLIGYAATRPSFARGVSLTAPGASSGFSPYGGTVSDFSGGYMATLPQASDNGSWIDSATPAFDFNGTLDAIFDYNEPVQNVSYGQSPMNSNQNIAAFLRMLRDAEHGPYTIDSARYRTFYGGATFTDLTDHPANTGAMKPVRLPDQYCRAVGLSSPCYSTAAGAYQFIKPTWNNLRENKGDGYGRLPDFSQQSQDIAALRLLKQIGALKAIETGQIAQAITLASRQWASLAGSTAGQPTQNLSNLLAWYKTAGGEINVA